MAPGGGGGVRAYGPALPSNLSLNSTVTRTYKVQYIRFYKVRFSMKKIATALVATLVMHSKVGYRKPRTTSTTHGWLL